MNLTKTTKKSPPWVKPAEVWDKLTSVRSGRQYNAAEARDTRVAARAWSAARCDLIGGRRGACGRGAQYANEVISVLPLHSSSAAKWGKRSREHPCTHGLIVTIVFSSLFSHHMIIITVIPLRFNCIKCSFCVLKESRSSKKYI